MKKLTIGITPYLDDGIQHVPKGYIKGITEVMGAEELVIRHETPLDELEGIVDQLDGMLFSGGYDVDPGCYGAEREPECQDPNHLRDALELKLLKLCLERKIPVLGICRGCQIINVGLGGTLIQDIPKRFGVVHQMEKDTGSDFDHDVRIIPGTKMYEIMGGDIRVNSYHHQCVDRLGEGAIATAFSPQGFIEAYEFPGDDQFLMAVQWHPEVTLGKDMYSERIFERFLKAIVG